jgi:hypothetical protein
MIITVFLFFFSLHVLAEWSMKPPSCPSYCVAGFLQFSKKEREERWCFYEESGVVIHRVDTVTVKNNKGKEK